MKSTHQFRKLTIVLGVTFVALAAAARSNAQVYPLETAIGKLRHIDQSKMTDAEKDRMSHDIDAAWDSIKSYGPEGVARLKKEVQTVEHGSTPDNLFKLNASALLWIIGKFDQADAIAAIWQTTPLTAQFNYVFYTAFEAAQTHDPRVLPMLKAVLRDREGETYIEEHSLTIGWPLAQQFIWGVYGSKGLPVLAETLASSNDPDSRASAIQLLSDAGYSKALPTIREIAASGKGVDRFAAVRALGVFGHPQDFDFLAAGIKTSDHELASQFAYALYEYDDLRAVPVLIPLVTDVEEQLPGEAFAGLAHLADRPAMDAVVQFCSRAKQQVFRDYCKDNIDGFLHTVDLDRVKYLKLTPAEKDAALSAARAKKYVDFERQKGDQPLTHQQLIEALDEWKAEHRAFSEQKMSFSQPDPAKPTQMVATTLRYHWVKERHILAVATMADADALIDTRGAVYERLSDECLSEVERINEILHRLTRSQYRREVGITDRAEAK